jgi:transposase
MMARIEQGGQFLGSVVMETYSLDLRERVLRAVDAGQESREGIARVFGVTSRWIRKLVQQRRETGSIAPLTHGGGREAKFTPARLKRLQTLVAQHPAATLEELQRKSRVPCCRMTVSRALEQLGYTRKKRRFVPANKIDPT